MTWKAWAAIVAALLIAFLVFTYMTRQQWVKQDAERLMQIERLQEEAREHAAVAAEADRRVNEARRSADASHAKMKAAQAQTAALRRKTRPVANTVEGLRGQLADADALIARLDGTVALADNVIFALQAALDASDERAAALGMQVRANEEAWKIERKRSDTWQQQTKRGKVKTAFLSIGCAAAGGLAVYGGAVATR